MPNLSLQNKQGFSLTETILLSVLLHTAFLFYIPSLNYKDTTLPVELNIDILMNEPELEPEPEPKAIKKIEPIPIKKNITPEPKVPAITPEPKVPAITPEPKAIVKKNVAPTSSTIKKTIESYSAQLTKAIARQKKYPRIAKMRGWQGEIILNLKIDGQGNLIKSTIKEKSGFKVLDNEGINMVKRASPFPKPPKELESKIFNVTVPISFKLK